MGWMDFKKIVMKYAGFIYVPEEVIDRNEPILLHIADTPRAIFSNMKRIVLKIQPQYIVHTGDLVDNLKLAIHPRLKSQYLHDVKGILKVLNLAKEKAYITYGNHDVANGIHEYNKIEVVNDGKVINIEGLNIMLAHQYKDLGLEEVDYKLFGHKPEIGLQKNELNGVDGIHIIFLKSGRVIRLNYPIGTNEIRTGTSKAGI